jgi:hypothetical protein
MIRDFLTWSGDFITTTWSKFSRIAKASILIVGFVGAILTIKSWFFPTPTPPTRADVTVKNASLHILEPKSYHTMYLDAELWKTGSERVACVPDVEGVMLTIERENRLKHSSLIWEFDAEDGQMRWFTVEWRSEQLPKSVRFRVLCYYGDLPRQRQLEPKDWKELTVE